MLDYVQFVLAPQMLNGFAFGIAIVLMALGLTIIFGLLDVINMSHGEFFAIGAYAGFVLLGAGVNFWVAVALVPLLMLPLGILTERLLDPAGVRQRGPAHADAAADARPVDDRLRRPQADVRPQSRAAGEPDPGRHRGARRVPAGLPHVPDLPRRRRSSRRCGRSSTRRASAR